jgi:hypothetical protein
MNPNAQKLAISIGLLQGKSKDGLMPAMRVPIAEIDGVKNINCKIAFYLKGKGISFEITAEFKYGGDDDEHPRIYFKSKYNEAGINKDDILSFSRELLDELPRLRLRHCGDLSLPDTEAVSMRFALEEVFASIECETVKIDRIEVCSVCYEKTDTKTSCNHPLCNRCWSKIEICGEDHNETACPLCRENIYYV